VTVAKTALIALILMLAACSEGNPDAPVTISVIEASAKSVAPPVLNGLTTSTAQGLVAFDAEGQIETALAERWIVTDDGLSIIFRIRRTKWADGRPVTSIAVARALQQRIASSERGRLQPLLSAIDQIIPMTGQVLEIRLKSPQRHILQLLAQPEMAIFSGRATNGTGPYALHSVRDGVVRLRLLDAQEEASERNDVRVRRESAAFAIARFAGREIGLVTGGGFANLPLVRPAGIATNQFSMDPADGLFGLAVVNNSEALAKINVRRALAMAIDREQLIGRFGLNSWRTQYSVLPVQLDSARPPAALEWVGLDKAARAARAKSYLAAAGKVSVIRVALPTGPGARLLFAGLSADWQKIGVSAVRVGMNEPADLRLIDEVAPAQTALWYLSRLGCARGVACSPVADAALNAASTALLPADRASAIAEADAAIASDQSFIPLAAPLRWSLVSPEMVGWRTNSFAVHPLRYLRKTPR
jgi:oligopeptide transport system substrate-binding protein